MRDEVLKYQRIHNLQVDNYLTQKEIARYLNLKQNTYSQYEIGVLNYPLDVVIRLALFYNTSVDCLVGLTDAPRPYKRNEPPRMKLDKQRG